MEDMFNMYVDVKMMAQCREKRRLIQDYFLSEYRCSCLSFTLNIPGPLKDTPLFREVHNTGVQEIDKIFSNFIIKKKTYLRVTGPEAFFAINMSGEDVKKQTVSIEENHYLGRIFDMDVIGKNGLSLSRTALGFEPRKCLICGDRAALCARSRRHNVDELLEQIRSIAALNKSFDNGST